MWTSRWFATEAVNWMLVACQKNSGTMSSFFGVWIGMNTTCFVLIFFWYAHLIKFRFFLWLDDQNASMKICWEFCKVWWRVSIFCHWSHTQWRCLGSFPHSRKPAYDWLEMGSLQISPPTTNGRMETCEQCQDAQGFFGWATVPAGKQIALENQHVIFR